METRQRQVVEAFQRVRAFLDEHPATGALSYTSALAMLDDVIEKVRSLASIEYRGREVSRAETRRQAEQLRVLVDEHIRPIVTIARAQIESQSDVGLPADFLAQFANARNKLERLTSGRTTQVGAHKAARSGLPVQMVRGRRAMERLDAIVRASHRRDAGVLAAWRSAKLVQKTPGGVGTRVPEAEMVPEVPMQVAA